MPTLDLSPIDARIAWARGHEAQLRDLVNVWMADALAVDECDDVERGRTVWRVRVVREPPIQIALARGDVLQQSRATLDNLVGVLRGGPTKSSAFRIDTDPQTFARDADRKLTGVPSWAVATMRDLQPFPDNLYRWRGDQLATLHRLAILDRHRALLLRAGIIDIDKVWVSTNRPGETEFGVSDQGRTLTFEHPIGAHADPHYAATVLALDQSWDDSRWPNHPSVLEVAGSALQVVELVVDMIRERARRESHPSTTGTW